MDDTAKAVPPRPASTPTAPVAPRRARERADAIAPFEDALRERFASREELLAEARATTLRQRGRRSSAGTAVLMAALVAGLWWADPAWRTEEIRTATGEQARWTLRDGSTIALNIASVLRVETRLRTRSFVLEQGEAAFHAAHGWRPFIVQAGAATVRDIGTVFNVRRVGGGANVTVIEGSVEVSAPGRPPQRLTAGQALDAAGTGPAQPVRQSPPGVAVAWQQGRLVFDGTPLADALAEIQRYRAAPIVLADARAGRLRLSGEYDIRHIEALIDALPQALPVAVQRSPDGGVRVAGVKKQP